MRRRILPFAGAGVVGFLVDAGVLLLVSVWLGAFGGRLVSFGAAVVTTWFINRNFAFADRAVTQGKRHEFLRYFAAMLPGAAVNWLVYGIALALLPHTAWGLIACVALASLAGMGTNLIAADRLAFRQR